MRAPLADAEAQMLVVGERINSTRKTIHQALETGDETALLGEATSQWAAGADYLDVNTATVLDGEPKLMAWLVERIQGVIPDALIAIDSPNAKALEAGLGAHRGRALLNSITAERERLETVLPLVREFRPRVIALAMDDDGLQRDAEKRFAVGAHLIELLAAEGVAANDVFVDPLIFPVSAEEDAGLVALDVMDRLKRAYPGVHTICGLSNVSHGLPVRKLVNQVFMIMAMTRGLDAVIVDPLDPRMMVNILTARLLLGQDPGCKRYVAAYRQGRLNLDGAPVAPRSV
jgi:5-methyltetrahydrofolate--homocysteine methyltransferase